MVLHAAFETELRYFMRFAQAQNLHSVTEHRVVHREENEGCEEAQVGDDHYGHQAVHGIKPQNTHCQKRVDGVQRREELDAQRREKDQNDGRLDGECSQEHIVALVRPHEEEDRQ
eukprot:1215581-Prymnesium_polylepis.1